MMRLLVTGASGLLGANLVLGWMERHEVIGVTHTFRLDHPRLRTRQADLAEPGAARRLFEEERPDAVVHCAAATDVDVCERDPARAYRLNTEMAEAVARAAAEMDIRLVHISTDAVFDGEGGPYREEDRPDPVNIYGKSKLEGEAAVQGAHPGALVVRTNFYGWNAQKKCSLAEWFLYRLERNEVTPGFYDVWISPVVASDLAEVFLRMIAADLRGLYHAGGSECVSKYDFGRAVARAFGLSQELVRPIRVAEAGLQASRQSRLCLDGSKLDRDLGVRLPGVTEGLSRMKQERERGVTAELKRMAMGGGVGHVRG